METGRPALDRPTTDPDKVLLLLEEGRDRELLADWFGSFPSYRVLTVDSLADLPEYDLCVFTEDVRRAAEGLLAERKAATDPVYLPHVLLQSDEEDGQAAGTAHDDHDFGLVDDVITMPVRQTTLRRRVENLLQARRASLRLVEREQQYRQLVELTPEGIVLVDDGTVLYGNTATVEMLDVADAGALEGRQLRSFVADEDVAAVEDILDDVAEDGRSSSYVEVTLERADGESVPCSIAGVAVTYEGRTVVQLVVRDLSERKEQQRRLDLFGRAIEVAAQGITIADARQEDTPLIYANEAFERITGYDTEKIIGRNCRFLQGEFTDPDTVARIRRAIDRREPVSVELLNYRKDGLPFWNALDIVPVHGADGEVTHFLGLQRDVTQRREQEQRVAVLDRVLRHNLRNQAGVIRGYADFLDPDDPSTVERARSKIRAAAEDLIAISEQVRTFRSVIEHDADEEATVVDLTRLVRRTTDEMRDGDDGDTAQVRVTATDTVRARVDPTLPAAVRDLFEMAADDGRFDLDVTVRTDGESAVLEIVDRGGSYDVDDLRVVGGEKESPLEHLQGVDLWLIRWSVEHSNGEFSVTLDEDPVVTIRLPAA